MVRFSKLSLKNKILHKNIIFYNKKPRHVIGRGSPVDRKPHYLFPLLDALSGLIFVFVAAEAVET